jgi:flavin reductase (DIM6/NTAB) family NADH-FMN oxidoreductase RutF
MSEFVRLDLNTENPIGIYDFLVSTVVPRPIALVSTLSNSGVPNLAPFSFFNLGGANPASLVVSPVMSAGGRFKDTYQNAVDTGEFVVNLVSRKNAAQMIATSAPIPPAESEWAVSGFTALKSLEVAPARVAECDVHFECKLFQAIRHGEGLLAACYLIGEVVAVHQRAGSAHFAPIARLGGSDYLDLEIMSKFEIPRP